MQFGGISRATEEINFITNFHHKKASRSPQPNVSLFVNARSEEHYEIVTNRDETEKNYEEKIDTQVPTSHIVENSHRESRKFNRKIKWENTRIGTEEDRTGLCGERP